ncbi:MAG: hypothetical protein RL110_1398, partial [Bacteroidota bacterium]
HPMGSRVQRRFAKLNYTLASNPTCISMNTFMDRKKQKKKGCMSLVNVANQMQSKRPKTD